MPSEILRAGGRRLSRRRHVAHAPELGRRQVRRAERRSEALCMCAPILFIYLFYSAVFTFVHDAQLVQSILDQSHLAPFTTHIQPILAEYDHAMRLYPLPTCVRTASYTTPTFVLILS